MIVTEEYSETLKRTYSDEGFYILKKGTSEKYIDAYDLKTSTWQFEETDEPIEVIPDAD
jgi:CCR4-NOT transcriptional regulation complex NOT5 subunit